MSQSFIRKVLAGEIGKSEGTGKEKRPSRIVIIGKASLRVVSAPSVRDAKCRKQTHAKT